uniref:C-type lectin domain family 2 member B-like isoform X2 n=1 Tax=Pogona vitticeps TaxID=103695 RepID=A0ABM5FIM2_9SAUR
MGPFGGEEEYLPVNPQAEYNGRDSGNVEEIEESNEDVNGSMEKIIEGNGMRQSPKCCPHGSQHLYYILGVSLLLNAILIVVTAFSERCTQAPLPLSTVAPVSCCPDGWIGYRRRCYYFGDTENDWESSKNNCSASNASLAVIDSQEDMDFILRYKGIADHWIGLQKDKKTEQWKWINDTVFNNWFPIRGGGKCAYANHLGIASSSCTREEHWICSKGESYTAH